MRCWAHSCEGHNNNLSTESPIKSRRRALSREHLARGLRSSPPSVRKGVIRASSLSSCPNEGTFSVFYGGVPVCGRARAKSSTTQNLLFLRLCRIPKSLPVIRPLPLSIYPAVGRVGVFSLPSLPLLKRTAGLSPHDAPPARSRLAWLMKL